MAEEWRVVAEVWLRRGVLDPQGQAVRGALGALGYDGVREVRVGKLVELWVSAADRDAAQKQARDMCSRLLANPVLEDFRVASVEPAGGAAGGAAGAAGAAGTAAGPASRTAGAAAGAAGTAAGPASRTAGAARAGAAGGGSP